MSKRTHVAHYAAFQPSDSDSHTVDYKFTATSEHHAQQVAEQFLSSLNRGSFGEFQLETVRVTK